MSGGFSVTVTVVVRGGSAAVNEALIASARAFAVAIGFSFATVVVSTVSSNIAPTRRRIEIFFPPPHVAPSRLRPLSCSRERELREPAVPLSNLDLPVRRARARTSGNFGVLGQLLKPGLPFCHFLGYVPPSWRVASTRQHPALLSRDTS